MAQISEDGDVKVFVVRTLCVITIFTVWRPVKLQSQKLVLIWLVCECWDLFEKTKGWAKVIVVRNPPLLKIKENTYIIKSREENNLCRGGNILIYTPIYIGLSNTNSYSPNMHTYINIL